MNASASNHNVVYIYHLMKEVAWKINSHYNMQIVMNNSAKRID